MQVRSSGNSIALPEVGMYGRSPRVSVEYCHVFRVLSMLLMAGVSLSSLLCVYGSLGRRARQTAKVKAGEFNITSLGRI